VTGRVRILEAGAMRFRLNLIVEAGFLPAPIADASEGADRVELWPPDREPYETAAGARASWRSQEFHVALDPRPIAAGVYGSSAEHGAELTEKGWLFQAEDVERGEWACFRYYGDPLVDLHFAVAQATDAESARSLALQRLEDAGELLESSAAKLAEGDEPTRALRDVMAWNTVWDDANSRAYTCLSRTWIPQLGGWGIWLSDVLYNVLMNARAGDAFMARENLLAVLAGQQPAGNLPCLIAGYEEWVDRTQLPVACFVAWRSYLLTGDRILLEEAYPALRRHVEWFAAARDGNGNGLFEYGSTPTGRAHNTHTKQGAMNESGMDDLPVFDDVGFDSDANTLTFEEPGHNSLISLEHQMLARIAAELGHDEEAAAFERSGRELAERISAELWDPEREIFAGRHWSGAFAEQLSPTSFFPLVAGAASPSQTEALIERHLRNEEEFWGPMGLPSTPFDDPISKENSYWRGRIWPPHLYFTWEGLRRAGRTELATELAERSWRMFEAEWTANRHCHENFHISDPEGHDSPDSDSFYSWGALIALMKAFELAEDVSPWAD
jgi:putative isomerase